MAGNSRTVSSSGASATRWMVHGRWTAKTAEEYGRIAAEAAKMMKWADPARSSLPRAVPRAARCRPSARGKTTVLEHTFEHVEFISLHTYLNNYADDTPAFLAGPDLMDSFIEEVVAIADAVGARRRSAKRIMLSFDEWNVWYRTRRNRGERVKPGWPVAPDILEEVYTLQDALTFGCALYLAAQSRGSREGRVPGSTRQRDRADHDRNRRPGMAPDDLLAVFAVEQFRSRTGAAGERRFADIPSKLL